MSTRGAILPLVGQQETPQKAEDVKLGGELETPEQPIYWAVLLLSAPLLLDG
jgi:hypothetical protein